jgi:hypothetical protein
MDYPMERVGFESCRPVAAHRWLPAMHGAGGCGTVRRFVNPMMYTSLESSFFAAGAERRTEGEMIENGPARDRIKHDLAHQLRVPLLHGFHFGGNVLRQAHPQINGTRFPHTSRLVVHRLFLNFSERRTLLREC